MRMRGQTQPPTYTDQTILDGGAKLDKFWDNCKREKRCRKSPYAQLLTIPVLRADYRCVVRERHERFQQLNRRSDMHRNVMICRDLRPGRPQQPAALAGDILRSPPEPFVLQVNRTRSLSYN